MNTPTDNRRPFIRLGQLLQQPDILAQHIEPAIARQHQQNPWFTPLFCHTAIHDIVQQLNDFYLNTLIQEAKGCCAGKTIAVIPAGDFPLQGFSTFLQVLLSGNHFLGKLPPHDNVLLPTIAKLLIGIEPAWTGRITFAPKISSFDAIIADIEADKLAAFESYFKGKPHLLRVKQNRTTILTGNESESELTQIANDIYLYFGKGPRSIKKLIVPENYDFVPLLRILNQVSQPIADHNQFLNNLEYQKAAHLINKRFYMDAGTFLFIESSNCNPPTGVVHYEYYHTKPTHTATKEPTVLQFLEIIS